MPFHIYDVFSWHMLTFQLHMPFKNVSHLFECLRMLELLFDRRPSVEWVNRAQCWHAVLPPNRVLPSRPFPTSVLTLPASSSTFLSSVPLRYLMMPSKWCLSILYYTYIELVFILYVECIHMYFPNTVAEKNIVSRKWPWLFSVDLYMKD